METQRDEVYERIPWETLEKRSGDRQWMVYLASGAVVVGALAFSFARNQPPAAAPATGQTLVETASTASPVPAATAPVAIAAAPEPVAPMVVAEADLYAVDPERLVDLVSAQAEWFTVEFISVDGTEEGTRALQSLLPRGAPLPEAPEGVQVFVDWVETMQVSQTGPTTYRVDVIARSLSSGDGEAFTRRPSMVVTVDVEVTDDGLPRVIGLPVISDVMTAPQADVAIVDLPADLAGRVGPDTGRVVGGLQRADGSWAVVVMGKGADGVARPTLVYP